MRNATASDRAAKMQEATGNLKRTFDLVRELRKQWEEMAAKQNPMPPNNKGSEDTTGQEPSVNSPSVKAKEGEKEDIISPMQSAFIPGRLITDNAFMAFECFHAIQSNSTERAKFCAYKLDMAKAYDRVDWRYLEGVMTKLGFHSTWIRWIMQCVTTVRYSVRLNGHALDTFTPTRGLRQGDPLSPYLFLLVADGLSRLVQQEVEVGRLKELKICRRAPGMSHLLFADDSLLFFEGSIQQVMVVKIILDRYEKATGQLVSLGKCSIMYGRRVPDHVQAEIKQLLCYDTGSFEEKYLGLPVPEGQMRKGKCKSLKDRFQKRLSDWVEKYLSSGGKEVLIKAILQGLPIYAMSVFEFPAGLVEELNQMIRDFHWGDEHERRRMHWLSWDKLMQPKLNGGMGFRDFRVYNQALLARQSWRLLQFPDSPCARLLKEKYYPSGHLLDTAFIQDVSATWKGVMHGLELLKQGAIWRIGSGAMVKIWRDNWLPRADNMKLSGMRGRCRLKWVSQLIDPETYTWDEVVIRRHCFQHDADAILQIKLPRRRTEDFVAWLPEPTGVFSVRSAYRLGMQPKTLASAGVRVAQSQLGSVASGIWFGRRLCHIKFEFSLGAWRLTPWQSPRVCTGAYPVFFQLALCVGLKTKTLIIAWSVARLSARSVMVCTRSGYCRRQLSDIRATIGSFS
ncbi:hypothetical protein QYE76_060682 [Lolium multiflorum]|uniref:Reverse transcriptase domain-containing protein n=1 Tax=Lolium multiflorum TaxID=4521 RepID=A0AAD8RZQ7_LOLMU|nr:hypothetical protein QYE76_060682 [Lolium multiflorum]